MLIYEGLTSVNLKIKTKNLNINERFGAFSIKKVNLIKIKATFQICCVLFC